MNLKSAVNQFSLLSGDSRYLLKGGDNLHVGINNPAAVKTKKDALGNEVMQGLPPYHRRGGFLVDEYLSCPAHWPRSSGRLSSYFVALMEGNGLWLDFNSCQNHGYHVAIVVSVQGINAITGLSTVDDQPRLEQYIDKCPRHSIEFGPNRFCKQCNYQWPKQNYLCTTGQPSGSLWLDGFRSADGLIRQYIVTLDKSRGVAKAVIGEKRVYAIGISFFLSKEKKPRPAYDPSSRRLMHMVSMDEPCIGSSLDAIESDSGDIGAVTYSSQVKVSSGNLISSGPKLGNMSKSASASVMASAAGPSASMSGILRSKSLSTHLGRGGQSAINTVNTAKMEVAAGAKIDQKIYDDPNPLDFWRDEHEGLVVINYALECDVEKILNGGKADLNGTPEGFMAGMKTGNPCHETVIADHAS